MSLLPQTRIARLVVAVSLTLSIGLLALLGWRLFGESPRPGGIQLGGPFSLTDQNGQTRTDRDFRGQEMLVFFGYTNCPGPCPTALNNMSLALNELGAAADKVTPVFVTVDPARDTVAAMHDYIASFHPRFVALTGPEADIRKLMRAYRVIGEPENEPSADGSYTVMHSTSIFLMDAEGRYVTHVPSEAKPADIAAAIKPYL
jgi:protein SCO1/2